jgi:hypothetical protein
MNIVGNADHPVLNGFVSRPPITSVAAIASSASSPPKRYG